MRTIEVQGLSVPALGMGTWPLKNALCRDNVAHALAVGYRHIDTAQSYDNEAAVGEALVASSVPREAIFVTTKLNLGNMVPDRVRVSTEESLARLRADYVDLLLMHWPTDSAPIEETLGAMESLREAGLTRAIGVSNFPPAYLERALATTRIAAHQVEFHPYLSQDALLEAARVHGHLFTGYSPLARGRVIDEPVIGEIAEAHGATPAQVAIAWVMAHPQTAAIPKASAPARLDDNLRAAGLTLTAEEVDRIASLDEGAAGRIVDPPHAPDWER